MIELLSLVEIQARSDDEWMLIGEPEVDASLSEQRGRVLSHSKNREEAHHQARLLRLMSSISLFMSRLPKDTEVVVGINLRTGEITMS